MSRSEEKPVLYIEGVGPSEKIEVIHLKGEKLYMSLRGIPIGGASKYLESVTPGKGDTGITGTEYIEKKLFT